jgi:hypothetical protein
MRVQRLAFGGVLGLVVGLTAASFAQESLQPRKIALLVGVNQYHKPGFRDLQFAEADVQAVARELEKLGFQVTLLLGSASGERQATLANIEAAAWKLVAPLGKRDLVLVMLSGHGQTLPRDSSRKRSFGDDALLTVGASGRVTPTSRSPSGDGADDQQRFLPRRHRFREGSVRPIERHVLLAGEEPQQRPPLTRRMVAVGGFEGIQHRPLRDGAGDGQFDLPPDPRQPPQMLRQNDANHGSVCTSTERTGGRSRTIADQWSPPSADKYTCPPVVPKYTPHSSSVSTAIASRRTLT